MKTNQMMRMMMVLTISGWKEMGAKTKTMTPEVRLFLLFRALLQKRVQQRYDMENAVRINN
jgi:spore coat protein CotF